MQKPSDPSLHMEHQQHNSPPIEAPTKNTASDLFSSELENVDYTKVRVMTNNIKGNPLRTIPFGRAEQDL